MLFFKKKHSFEELNFRKDCHCHLLPGVDDGIKTLEDSVRVLESMVESGIREVILTPHIYKELFPNNTEASLRDSFEKFMNSLPVSLRGKIRITLGGEYMVDEGFENRNPKSFLQFEQGKVLMEMSYFFISHNMEEAIFAVSMAGLTPVIAHPERYLYLSRSLETFDRYHDMGAEFQMNILSLSGCYGPESVRILDYLLKKELYSYMGTDTHSVSHFNNITEIKFGEKFLPHLAAFSKSCTPTSETRSVQH